MRGESQRTSDDMSLQLASLHHFMSIEACAGKVSRQRVACCSPFASLLRDINQRTGATCMSSANTCVIIRGENVEVGWVRLGSAPSHPGQALTRLEGAPASLSIQK